MWIQELKCGDAVVWEVLTPSHFRVHLFRAGSYETDPRLRATLPGGGGGGGEGGNDIGSSQSSGTGRPCTRPACMNALMSFQDALSNYRLQLLQLLLHPPFKVLIQKTPT